MPPRDVLRRGALCLGRLLLRALRGGLPKGDHFADGVAWAVRMVLIGVHLCFAIPAIHRPNIPLFLPSYAAFDDSIPFAYWGYAGVLIALLLWTLPPRVPWGIISSSASAFYMYLLAAMFARGAGFISGVLVYVMAGVLSACLLTRAMWAWALTQGWFREHVLKDKPHAG